MKIFYPDGPRPDLSMSLEEKARRARRFRRTAALADACLLLALAASIFGAYTELISKNGYDTVTVPLVNALVLALAAAALLAYVGRSPADAPPWLSSGLIGASLLGMAGMLAGEILAFRRCPFCGRKLSARDWTIRPFVWRAFRCPDCDFVPHWGRRD